MRPGHRRLRVASGSRLADRRHGGRRHRQADEEIGEVAKRLTPETLITMPDVNWRSVKGMREVIAHDYDDVDVDVLAGVVRDDLPGLRATVSASLASS